MLVVLLLILVVMCVLLVSKGWPAAMVRVLRLGIVILLLLIAGLIGCPSSRDFLAIDRCLDAGGRWNYDTRQCER